MEKEWMLGEVGKDEPPLHPPTTPPPASGLRVSQGQIKSLGNLHSRSIKSSPSVAAQKQLHRLRAVCSPQLLWRRPRRLFFRHNFTPP